MKTVEEKAKEYSNSEGIYNEHGERLLYMGYLAGCKEATRWRDPKEELPEYYKKVELKIKRGDSIDYVNACLLAYDDGSLFFGDYNFAIFIRFKDVIGWRLIE